MKHHQASSSAIKCYQACFMTFYDALWCFTKLHDTSWCFMTLHDASWCFMTLHDALWRFMMLYYALWRFMMLYDALLCFMMLYDALWCFMTLYNTSWHFMTLHDALWCFMMLYDVSWCTMKPSPSQLINSIDHVRPYWYTNYKQNNYYTTISKCKWQQHMGSALNIVLFQMNQLRFKMVVSGSLNANIIMFAWEILCENTSLSGLRLHLILS